MDRKKEIIKKIMDMSGSRSPYNVFSDWVECMALAIQNNSYRMYGGTRSEVWRKREEQYRRTVEPYGPDGEAAFAEMLLLLGEAMTENLSDALGEIYMEANMGNKNTGQFFTPFHVSLVTAKLVLKGADLNGKFPVHEPAAGSGGMIIAVAKALLDEGVNPQRVMEVVAQDLDWKAVYMCYVQLSLLGLKATVIQGDTLCSPYTPGKTNPECVFYTPAKMGLLPWVAAL